MNFAFFEDLLDQFGLVKKKRVEALAELLRKARDELSRRDLSSLSTKQLMDVVDSLQSQLSIELRDIRYRTGEYEPICRDLVESMTPEQTVALDQ